MFFVFVSTRSDQVEAESKVARAKALLDLEVAAVGKVQLLVLFVFLHRSWCRFAHFTRAETGG